MGILRCLVRFIVSSMAVYCFLPAGTSSMTVISGGDRKRMGGPHVPEPRLT